MAVLQPGHPRSDPIGSGPRRSHRARRQSQTGRRELEGTLPLPRGEDTLLQRQPAQGDLQVLRVWRGGRRLRISDASGQAHVPRSGARARQDRRCRAARGPRPDSESSGREELFRAMALAARVYADALGQPGGARARAYLEQRGVDPEVARRFGLGLAPEGWEFLDRRSEGGGRGPRRSGRCGSGRAAPGRRRRLRPLSRAAHLPDPRSSGTCGRARGSRPRRRAAEIPQLARDAHLFQGQSPLRGRSCPREYA